MIKFLGLTGSTRREGRVVSDGGGFLYIWRRGVVEMDDSEQQDLLLSLSSISIIYLPPSLYIRIKSFIDIKPLQSTQHIPNLTQHHPSHPSKMQFQLTSTLLCLLLTTTTFALPTATSSSTSSIANTTCVTNTSSGSVSGSVACISTYNTCMQAAAGDAGQITAWYVSFSHFNKIPLDTDERADMLEL
jgi:hypothetical protein